MKTVVNWRYLGQMDYEIALALQQRLHNAVVEKRATGFILGLEHPSTITLGSHATSDEVTVPTVSGSQDLVLKLIQTNRGGQVTGHEPGQLVIYPILPLVRTGVRNFVTQMEDATIRTLRHFGVNSQRHTKYPGVWVEDRKICSLGFRIHKKVSMHGLAINIHNDLEIFRSFVPCGIRNVILTSLKAESTSPPSLIEFFRCWLNELAELRSLEMQIMPSDEDVAITI